MPNDVKEQEPEPSTKRRLKKPNKRFFKKPMKSKESTFEDIEKEEED